MESQLQVERGTGSATQGGYEGISAFEPKPPLQTWEFVSEFQQLLGEDSEPDPMFFVDSWTLGMGAAVESFKQRRQAQANRERESREFNQLVSLGARAVLEESALYPEFISLPTARQEPDTAWQASQEPSAQTAYQSSEEWNTFAEASGSSREEVQPMTEDRARQLLGVTPASAGTQIKAAYRRLVSQWHPDHLECRTEETRQFATARMAAINEAYHLLRRTMA
ncbi:MAG: J domain-containing protein [Terracidiphilus sp.]|jgi:hypothetical protein